VDWVTGACMLVNAALMREVGGMDEDFFLYHEEVAFSRVAQQRGWRVEFDPSVSVVHRHPLQNRAISPKMRVITRHSKLLYFHKHLPDWHFRILAAVVRLEAAIRGRWSAIHGRREEVWSWTVIGEVARRLRRGDAVRGREILDLALERGSPMGRSPGVRGELEGRQNVSRPPHDPRPSTLTEPLRTKGGTP
jgi:GT2 family glycosyltransferase